MKYVDSLLDNLCDRRGGFYQPSMLKTKYLVNPPRLDTGF